MGTNFHHDLGDDDHEDLCDDGHDDHGHNGNDDLQGPCNKAGPVWEPTLFRVSLLLFFG